MKKILSLPLVLFSLFTSAQIPMGNSQDTLSISTLYKYWTYGPKDFDIYYYKPSNYDPATSPILFAIHGAFATGDSPRNSLTQIAERQNALIVAPTMKGYYQYAWIQEFDWVDPWCEYYAPYPLIMHQIYNHVLEREGRSDIPVYLIGNSGGGQFVTRYMLMRQGIHDSIPIKMAISSNPYSYTFCRDSVNGNISPYGHGIAPTTHFSGCSFTVKRNIMDWGCNSHVIQYYNENYAVFIGTADTLDANPSNVNLEQGANRYERAKNFYAFSDSDAVARGTSLNWQYHEIPNMGHGGDGMYNAKANPSDTFTIVENVLFNSPYKEVPKITPVADFSYSINGLEVNFTDLSTNIVNNWQWDFGDGSNSIVQNPVHTFSDSLTYTICLIAGDSCAQNYYCRDINLSPIGIDETFNNDIARIFSHGNNIIVKTDFDGRMEVFSTLGRRIHQCKLNR